MNETTSHPKLSLIDRLQYRLLSAVYPAGPIRFAGNPYEDEDKLQVLLGDRALARLKGRVVVDFGCGEGREAKYLLKHGASHVIGVDLREECIDAAHARAEADGIADRCFFTRETSDLDAEVVVSLDSFEHFADPAAILRVMHNLLRPGGSVITTFGPTWYHPYGGHSLSAFPWAHLVLRERALLRWRADLYDDGATTFAGISGGLNKLTISRFLTYIEESEFEVASLELVPIRKVARAHNRLTREFTTAIVRCELSKAGVLAPSPQDDVSSDTQGAKRSARTRARRTDP